ncbi:MAG: HAMP domain-containing protein [Chloroflexi bacterium]|nr:HAMP domain-containing protein [Chloroflexota bacterium]
MRHWFDNLKVRVKLLLMLAIPLAALLYFAVSGVVEKASVAANLARLETLVAFSTKVGASAHALQRERGSTAMFITTQSAEAQAKMNGYRADTDEAVAELEAALQTFDRKTYGAAFEEAVKAALDKLAIIDERRGLADSFKVTAPESNAFYTGLIADLLNVNVEIADLAEDRNIVRLASNYIQLLEAKEHAGQERAMGSAAFGAGEISLTEYGKFVANAANQQTHFDVFLEFAPEETRELYESTIAGDAVDDVARMKQVILDSGPGVPLGIESAYWFDQATVRIDLLKVIEDKLAAELLGTAEAARGEAQATLWFFIGVSVAAVGLGVGGGLFIANAIARPLQAVTRAAQQMAGVDMQTLTTEMGALAQGDLTRRMAVTAQTLDIRSNDEVGAMAQAFNTIIDRLQKVGNAFDDMTANLRDLVGEVAQNAESVRAASDQLSSTAQQAGQATTQIATTMQQIATGTQQQAEGVTRTAVSVEQMRRAIEGVAKGAQEQAAAAGKTSNITAQMVAAIEQVAQNAQAVTKDSALAAESAQAGSKTVRETIVGMTNIIAKVGVSADKVKEMGQRSEQIGAIVEAIDDIASQTNLLALNAAIEAARAGEHGKGFAVVADEVRKLAERASAATKEIGGLIRNIQQTVNQAVAAMDEGVEEVEAGAARAAESGQALANILKAVEAVSQQAELALAATQRMGAASAELASGVDSVSAVVEENTAATEEMAAGSEEVTRAIENIASVSEENSAAVEEVSAASEEMSAQVEEVSASAQSLNEMALALQGVVSRFKLSADESGRAISPPAADLQRPASQPKLAKAGHRYEDLSLASGK